MDKINNGICRRCLNEKYGAKVLPQDCKYFTFPEVCPHCNKVSNIVIDVRPTKRYKLWFKKEKTPAEK